MLQRRLSMHADRRPSCAMRRGASSPGVPLRAIFVKAKPPLRATRLGRRGLICLAPAALMGFGPFAGLLPLQVSRCLHQPGPACSLSLAFFPIVFIGPAAAQRHECDCRRRANEATQLPGLSFRWFVSGVSKRRTLFDLAGPFLPWAFPPSGLSERAGRFARAQASGPFHLLHRTLAHLMSRSAHGFAASFPQTVFCGPRGYRRTHL
jgi:hypothetical protein